jgi:hypothetical protein
MNQEWAQAYVDATAGRLAADGCQVSRENWGGSVVTIGYRSDFRLRWMATKLHLLTVIATVPVVCPSDIEGFTNTVLDYADRQKGQLRGLQSGVAAFPCLIGGQVDPAALAWAQAQQRSRFALMARPVVVDSVTGTATCFRGTAIIGFAFSGHLRKKLVTYFPVANQAPHQAI